MDLISTWQAVLSYMLSDLAIGYQAATRALRMERVICGWWTNININELLLIYTGK